MEKARDILLMVAFGGGSLDWNFFDSLMEKLDSANYDTDIIYDDIGEVLSWNEGLNFDGIISIVFKKVIRQFIDDVVDEAVYKYFGAEDLDYYEGRQIYLDVRDSDDFINFEENLYYYSDINGFYSAINLEFKDYVYEKRIDDFIDDYVYKDDDENIKIKSPWE